MSAPHILIAGAGIGGLAAALSLARRGIASTVVEKRTGFGETGAGLQLTPNSGRVLEALDLALPLKRVGVSSNGLAVRRWRDGAPVVEMPADPAGAPTPFRLMSRIDLHTVLLDAARAMPNIRFVVGRGVEDVRQDDAGVTATLSSQNGSETLHGLGLIGADGLWSRIRGLTGDAAAPEFTGYEAWRAMVPTATAPGIAGEKPRVTLHLGPQRHAVHYPVSSGRQINLVVLRQAREAREGWTREGDRAVLTEHLAGASPALRQLAGAAGGWQVWSLFDRKPAAMAKGRIALLGDAAHPVLPFLAQGASLAIEDAGVLARLLAQHLAREGAAGVQAAMAAYAAARAQRVARVQEASRENGRNFHLGWPWSIGRDLVLRRLGPEGMRKRYDWLYGWRDAG
ncbi:FAD-dependent monooxygenase [Bosea sp. SSUT16]|uniref:FAD-dependent monooxygenase n=1 Tax=Bosea spartocytisi TaxID=2773451 RepID=A0A927EEM1_9HYPH|nr:FAD-dependent monooxygenase [Bosea spartocytisi]MBD3848690.1 FAD-dependent monooxygenase [Bosea spartocytisi]MCT4471722.1 FAD-dependent monooxygenase [Bosea spartocytisi]